MMTKNERYALVEFNDSEIPIIKQAELLTINRSSLYYRPIAISLAELNLRRQIDELYTKYPYYGTRKISRILKVNRKKVQRLMREMGISAIYPRPNLSRRNHKQSVYPYLLRNITVSYPNHVWGIDITYIRLHHGWMYLVAIIDWYSRYIVSWELSQTIEIDFVLSCVKKALKHGKPAIMNSDQGGHFTSPKYIELFQESGVQISMDGKGRALDNIFTERFWRNIKWEEVYLKDYQNPREARIGITEYIRYYNCERPHQSLDYHFPSEVYCVPVIISAA
jgi:putative transposase